MRIEKPVFCRDKEYFPFSVQTGDTPVEKISGPRNRMCGTLLQGTNVVRTVFQKVKFAAAALQKRIYSQYRVEVRAELGQIYAYSYSG